MNDPLINRFADACGAVGPLDLRVDLADGGVLAEGSVAMPFTLVGRDDACDVTLNDAEVNPRHVWLQAVGGRLYAVDLGSRTGLAWPGGSTGSGWLDAGVPVRVGPFQLRLRCPVASKPAEFPPGYNPVQSDPSVAKNRPPVVLEFRNGKRGKDRWTVNRLITLVGRAPECKINLTADDIVGYHCGLVLTPDGLWVVDLSGRGVVVNGERMRVSPLRHGAELWVGRFLIGTHYPAAANTPALGRPGLLTPPTPLPGLPQSPAPDAPAEDEVPLGIVPPSEQENGLPSSHIMADAFRSRAGGPISNAILVSPSGPNSGPAPDPQDTPAPAGLPPRPAATEPAAEAVLTLLRQLGDLHAQAFAYFQQSFVLMVRLFGCLRPEQLPIVQRELGRIQELNSELAQLQGELARRAGEMPALPRAGAKISPTPPNGFPDAPAPPNDGTGLHAWVMDRIDSLQKERQTRWQSLVGLFSTTSG